MCCMDQIGNLKKLFLLIINEYYRIAVYGLTPNGQDAGSKHSKEKLEAVGAVAGHIGFEATSTAETLNFWKQRKDAAHMFLDNRRLKSSNETGKLYDYTIRAVTAYNLHVSISYFSTQP
ncbi:hypothetical protein KP79_PYT20184 [Mizuhopecten yessoensis]|uniref:Uncharacterized protein n=1 Tax=Mizuhopecten yessoensis TaxID=6573 RepID=A0A210R759_MIZYE|nr:hypothetical protein KP79_PYT20184 [Mizuhopecten yessoensis]